MSEHNDSIQNFQQKTTSDMSIGDWLITFFALSVPIVGIIFWVIWIGDSIKKPSRRTYLIALVIWSIILIILAAVFWGTVTSVLLSFLNNIM